jgi:soluble lytic murein transglycosylase
LIDTRPVSAPAAGRAARRPARLDRWMAVTLIVMLLVMIGLILAKAMMETYLYTQQAAREAAHQKLLAEHPLPEQYLQAIEEAAQQNNVKPAFLAAIILCESSYRKDAESSVGARGLMQVMPDTASWIAGKLGEESNFNIELMYDPLTNIRYGSWYIGYLSQMFGGDPVLVASAYHAGQGEVSGWLMNPDYSLDGQSIHINDMADGPTKQYAQRVVSAYAIYERLYFTKEGQPT